MVLPCEVKEGLVLQSEEGSGHGGRNDSERHIEYQIRLGLRVKDERRPISLLIYSVIYLMTWMLGSAISEVENKEKDK